MIIGDICYWRAIEESTSTFEMKSREAMVLIFNSTVSREISGTNFIRTRLSGNIIALGFASCTFIATPPNTCEISPEFHSYPCYYIYIYSNWRASEESEKLSGVYKFKLVQYKCIYIYV